VFSVLQKTILEEIQRRVHHVFLARLQRGTIADEHLEAIHI
jgi:hypothetical protein